MGGGGGKSGKGGTIQVPFYHISMQIGLCHSYGETELVSVYAGDKLVSDTVAGFSSGFRVLKEKLFGGPRKEGGLKGSVWFYGGHHTQTTLGPHAARLGRTPETCPAFRGIASLWLTGFHTDIRLPTWRMDTPKGFYISSGNPYIKPFKFRLRRKSVVGTALSSATAMLRIQDRSNGQPMYAVNPAHVLYECYTNRVWGEGRSAATINAASFDEAATTLFAEKFGISFVWLRQTEVEKVVQEIVDHIQAAIYDDPQTGLLTIKLLRKDYVTSSLPQISTSNAKMTRFRRKLWGEVSSEVVVTWTNPEDEREMTVTAHNLSAAIAQGGTPISTSRNFYMVRSPELAARLAERELKSVSYPLAALDVEVFRQFSTITPGSVVSVTWPDKGMNAVAMRVMEVSPGSSQSDKMLLKLQEDIFALPSTTYLKPIQTLWQDASSPLQPLFSGYTMPGYVTARVLGYATVAKIPYPAAVAGFLGTRYGVSDREFEVSAPVTLPTGATELQTLTSIYYSTTGKVDAALVRQTTTTIEITDMVGSPARVGDFVIIDNLGPTGEIAVVTGFGLKRNSYIVSRGILDTTPKAWPANTSVYFFNPVRDNVTDPTERASGETVSYTISPMRTLGLNTQSASNVTINVTLTDRAHRPLRPGNVRANGWPFAEVNVTGATVSVAWENRNRSTESQQVIGWEGGNSAPEIGQTTFIRLLDDTSRAVFKEYTGLTGQSFSFPKTDFGSRTRVIMMVGSTRDGFDSFNAHEITLKVG